MKEMPRKRKSYKWEAPKKRKPATRNYPTVTARKCVGNMPLAPSCKIEAKTITLPKNFLLFTGVNNQSAEDFEQYGIEALIGKSKDETERTKRTTAFVLYGTASITSVNRDYGSNGGILVSRLNKKVVLHLFRDVRCETYFEGTNDYNSSAAQCFCNNGLNGYANGIVHHLSNPFGLDDVAICDASDTSIISPIGFIKCPFESNDLDLIRRMEPIGGYRGHILDAYVTQFENLVAGAVHPQPRRRKVQPLPEVLKQRTRQQRAAKLYG